MGDVKFLPEMLGVGGGGERFLEWRDWFYNGGMGKGNSLYIGGRGVLTLQF